MNNNTKYAPAKNKQESVKLYDGTRATALLDGATDLNTLLSRYTPRTQRDNITRVDFTPKQREPFLKEATTGNYVNVDGRNTLRIVGAQYNPAIRIAYQFQGNADKSGASEHPTPAEQPAANVDPLQNLTNEIKDSVDGTPAEQIAAEDAENAEDAVAATPSPEEFPETPSQLNKGGIRDMKTGKPLTPSVYIGKQDSLADKVKNYAGSAADWTKKNAGYVAATAALVIGSYFIGGAGKVSKSDLEKEVAKQTSAIKSENDKTLADIMSKLNSLTSDYAKTEEEKAKLAETIKAKDKALADAGSKVLAILKDADKRVADLKQEYESKSESKPVEIVTIKPVTPPTLVETIKQTPAGDTIEIAEAKQPKVEEKVKDYFTPKEPKTTVPETLEGKVEPYDAKRLGFATAAGNARRDVGAFLKNNYGLDISATGNIKVKPEHYDMLDDQVSNGTFKDPATFVKSIANDYLPSAAPKTAVKAPVVAPVAAPKVESTPAEVVELKENKAPVAAPAVAAVKADNANELKTVTVRTPGKGRDLTPYWSEWSEMEGSTAGKHESRIQQLKSQLGIDNQADEAALRAEYWTSVRNYQTALLAGHGQAAEANANVYLNTVAKLNILRDNKKISAEDHQKGLDELTVTLFNRHTEGDVREGAKNVRVYNDAGAVMHLSDWKNTAAISRLLNESPVDVFKAYDGNKTIKGAKQAAALARTFDAQMKAVLAETQFASLEQMVKDKKPLDAQLVWSVLVNATYAEDVGVDQKVDDHMKQIVKRTVAMVGGEGKGLQKKVESFVDKQIVGDYGKKLPGEMRHDIMRALYELLVQTVPGVTSRNADYRRGFDMPQISEVEQRASTLYSADTLKGLLDMTQKFQPLGYSAERELGRLYGYTLMLNADGQVRAADGNVALRNGVRIATNLEKAELVFHALDESRGHGTKLVKEIRKAMANEMHDKYDVDRMLIMELGEREVMIELPTGKKLVQGIKTATGLDLLNQLRKAAQWSLLGLQLSGGGHPHKPGNPPGDGGLGGGQTGGPGVGGGNPTPGGGLGGGNTGGPGVGGGQ